MDFPFEPPIAFSGADDHIHRPGPNLDWTETTWWSFNVPERALAGWLYAQVRPNLGLCTGGAFVYQGPFAPPWELPYFAWTSFDRLPERWDFDDVEFRNGVRVKAVEAGMRYEVGYRFRDQRDFTADLVFDGLTPPVPHLRGAPPFTESSHYDQHGRVTGTIDLRGETIDVDCLAVRDRSWGRRPEHLGRTGRLSYAFGTNRSGEAFLVFCVPPREDGLSEVEHSTSGYLLRDGTLRPLARVERRNDRDPRTGGVRRIELSGEDTDGRPLRVTGVSEAAMALPGSGKLTINTLLRWGLPGGDGWGEDQDVWPMTLVADRIHGVPGYSREI